MVIKSTVPAKYTEKVRQRFQTVNIILSPELLREGKLLCDDFYQIVGEKSKRADKFANLLIEGAINEDTTVFFTNSTELVKLFYNVYLLLRVTYFNELDTYFEFRGLNTRQIIEGVGLTPRIEFTTITIILDMVDIV